MWVWGVSLLSQLCRPLMRNLTPSLLAWVFLISLMSVCINTVRILILDLGPSWFWIQCAGVPKLIPRRNLPYWKWTAGTQLLSVHNPNSPGSNNHIATSCSSYTESKSLNSLGKQRWVTTSKQCTFCSYWQMSVLFVVFLRKMVKEMDVAWDLQTALEMQEEQIDTLLSK